jgi:Flp pilus assembly protein TadG
MMMRKLRSFTISMAARHGVKSARLDRFRSEEDGALIVFGLIIFTLMLIIGGMAVDFMYHERMRTDLVQTLDRSVLAAANLKQTLDPVGVVEDFFAKAGMTRYLEDVTAEEGLNYTTVRANAKAETYPNFLHWVGINKLPAFAASAATQEITDVEIQLVLDVSGSMNEASGATTKIAALKVAAKSFVQSVLDDGGADRVSIGIVPYNAQVNLGPVLRSQYTMADWHGVANIDCVELPDSAFSSAFISSTTPTPMAYADTVRGTTMNNTNTQPAYVSETSSNSNSGAKPYTHFCGPYDVTETTSPAVNIVQLPTNDLPTLNSRINGLYASGNTSITLGMRWGLALIDPGARPMYATLATEGKIPAVFNNRPYDYRQAETLKVIVLMTDGIHVAHPRVKPVYRSGLSPIWVSAADGKYSINLPGNSIADAGGKAWWVPHRVPTVSSVLADVQVGWQNAPWDGVGEDVANDARIVTQLTWNEVWARQRVSWVAWQLYARAYGGTSSAARTSEYNTWWNNIRADWKAPSDMDTFLRQSCTLAKTNGVIVYTIALEAPAGAQTLLDECSTAGNFYFNATDTVKLQEAFDLIASQISYLRLTQ